MTASFTLRILQIEIINFDSKDLVSVNGITKVNLTTVKEEVSETTEEEKP